MKKNIIVYLIIFFLVCYSYAENKNNLIKASEKIEKKLVSINIKNYKIKENFSKMITKLYLFDENNMSGGIALTKLDNYNIDIYIFVLNQKDYAVIKTVAVIDENSLRNKAQMQQLVDLFKGISNQRIDKFSDSISGATKYTKKIYIKIKVIAMQLINELEKEK
jgi:hypothetical protein